MSVGALLLGGIIYLTFRTSQLLLFRTFKLIGFEEYINQWRQAINLSLPQWAIFCLPDALWASAYILIIDTLLNKYTLKTKLIVASIIPSIGIVSELMQALQLLPGTFDIFDIVAYSVPFLLYIFINLTITK